MWVRSRKYSTVCVWPVCIFDSRLTCVLGIRFSISLRNESNEYGNGMCSLISCVFKYIHYTTRFTALRNIFRRLSVLCNFWNNIVCKVIDRNLCEAVLIDRNLENCWCQTPGSLWASSGLLQCKRLICSVTVQENVSRKSVKSHQTLLYHTSSWFNKITTS